MQSIPPRRAKRRLQAHFSPDHPPPRLNFTYEDNIKMKYKQVAGISRPPQSRETIPLKFVDHSISGQRNTQSATDEN
jgi:hypothetical protein